MQSDTTCTGQAILYYAIVTMSMLKCDTITHTHTARDCAAACSDQDYTRSPVRASQDLKRGNAAWPDTLAKVSHTIQCSSSRNKADTCANVTTSKWRLLFVTGCKTEKRPECTTCAFWTALQKVRQQNWAASETFKAMQHAQADRATQLANA